MAARSSSTSTWRALVAVALLLGGTACQSGGNQTAAAPTSPPASAPPAAAPPATAPATPAAAVVPSASSAPIVAAAPSPSPSAAVAAAPGGLVVSSEFSGAIRQVAQRAKPAVVQITNEQQVRIEQFNQPFTVPAGVGSGLIYDNQGHILTNNH